MATEGQSKGRAAVHDTLVYRLSQILMKFNRGEPLHINALAAEFGVHPRTIQRDLNERLGELPLTRVGSCYTLDQVHLDKYQLRDVQRFAKTAGVEHLFPNLLAQLRGVSGQVASSSAISVRGHEYESLAGFESAFAQLERAILDRSRTSFDYVKPGAAVRTFEGIAPYRLVNQNGIWYLIALRGVDLKTFAFTRIRKIAVGIEKFTHDPAVDQQIDCHDSIWFGGEKTRVMVQVAPAAASFFERRKLLPGQVITEKKPDGSLLLVSFANHLEQVLPVAQYWVPHLRILEPVAWQKKLEAALVCYLGLDSSA